MNISLAISAASAVLAFILAFQAYHAYKFARKDYLLNFSAGFLLLALSYVILIPLALGVNLPAHFQDTDDIVSYPVFAIMQTIGYLLIALAYSQTAKSRKILVSLIGFLILLVALVLLPSSFVPLSVDVLLYLLNTSLLAYVLYHMLKIMPPTDLVFVGFLLLAMHEYTQLITQITEFIYNYPDDGYFLVSQVLRLSALCMLFASFLLVHRQKLVPIRVIGSGESA